jgi:glycerol-3-phosphate dehydrogenase
MKFVILGAGALGTVLSAHLARAGEDVTLIARGQRAAYLQEHGATLTGLVDFTVPVPVVTDPSQIHDADVLVVTVTCIIAPHIHRCVSVVAVPPQRRREEVLYDTWQVDSTPYRARNRS